ncbi:hypothetical protein [Zoogloea sp.]|uniref:hypothetical protein n=1 Tax=Zoogloea sp. TaxID=49181 RepID=UPI00321FA3B6
MALGVNPVEYRFLYLKEAFLNAFCSGVAQERLEEDLFSVSFERGMQQGATVSLFHAQLLHACTAQYSLTNAFIREALIYSISSLAHHFKSICYEHPVPKKPI